MKTKVALLMVGLVLATLLVTVAPLQAAPAMRVTSVTLDDKPSVTVTPGTLIEVVVLVECEGEIGWRGTGYKIGSDPDPWLCKNTDNHVQQEGTQTYTETFDITAPAGAGTYKFKVKAWSEDGCSGRPSGASSHLKIKNAITVTAIPEFPAVALPIATMLGLMFFFYHRSKRKKG